MFNAISHCVEVRGCFFHKSLLYYSADRPIQRVALGADWIIGSALVVIGALSLTSILWGGIPLPAQCILIGSGGVMIIWAAVKTSTSISEHVKARHFQPC